MLINRKNVKRMVIYINDSQKNNLQSFLHSIGFHYYTIQSKLEGSWEYGIRHLNNHVWPGSEAVFHLIISGDKVETLLKKLKSFRTGLPDNVVMAVLVCPLDDFIYNMQTVDIEPDDSNEKVHWLKDSEE